MSHDEPPRAKAALAAAERRAWRVALPLLLLSVVAFAVPVGPVQLLAAALFTGSAVFGLQAYRTRTAKRHLRNGCMAEVLAVGWTRVPDGCNYAIFPPESDPTEREPDLVIRLPRAVATGTQRAWLCGSSEPSLVGGVALIDRSGRVVAVGRVRSPRSGAKVWARRHAPTPRWMGGRHLNDPPDA